MGKNSGVLRQIDVSVRKNVGQFELLVAIDCKDTKRPIGVKGIEESIGLFQDVEAHRGVVVSAAGFTKAAKTLGAKAGLDLYRLIDAESHDWKAIVSLPALVSSVGIRSYKFSLSSVRIPIEVPAIDPRHIVLFDVNKQKLGTIMELLLARWDQLEPPIEPEIVDLELVEGTTYLLHNETYYEVVVKAHIIVEQKLFFGDWPIEEIKGFHDEIKGQIITQSFTTAGLDFVEVEQTWQRIESIESLAVQPVISIKVKNVYGDLAVNG